MKQRPFVHLHLHTNFSLLDGACHIDQVVEKAHKNNMPAVACTDHGVMYGIVDFYQKALSGGVKPILGCEVYVAPQSRFDTKTKGASNAANHLVLLATHFQGYRNLCKLVTSAHLEGFYYKPRIDKEILSRYSDGLIGLSGCLKGEITSQLNQGNMKRAAQIAGEYADILGKENFYLELQDHGLSEQKKTNPMILELARKNGIPYVATNDVHYLEKEHASAHEVLLCMQTQTVLSDPKRMRYGTHEFYMKTREEMEQIFGEIPEALDLTVEIAERCNVELEFGKLHFPAFEVPENYTQKEYLIKLCKDGLSERYELQDPDNPRDPEEQQIVDRMLHEFDVIEKTGFINYFLVVWDFINFARKNNIAIGPGRGSGGGSVVAYSLGITSIDPLRFGLLFERFLNPERISPPDFDIDFCKSRREEVIEYVINRYGRDNVAQIITFGSLGAKLVVRDVGRVLEIPYAKCDQLSKMIPDDPKMTLKKALEMNPEFRKAYENDPDCKNILDYGFVLEGLYRNPGTHAAGVVIGEKPLREIVPLSRDKEKQPVTQYTMKPLERIGLLKMDFLGLRTLTVIRHT
ncbi:MAG: DNA polymerase III subunit alpha, partial [Verrucomicrobiota bacterium]